jgi:hypothetical protein
MSTGSNPVHLEIDPEEDPSAVGAVLNQSYALAVSLSAYPRDLQFPFPANNPVLETLLSPLSSREPVTFSIFRVFCISNQLYFRPPTKPSS